MDLLRKKTQDHVLALFCQLQTCPEFQWDWYTLSLNKSLPLFLIERFIDKPWDWVALSCHPKLTWSFIQRHMGKPWYWPVISSHHLLTCEIVIEHPELPWDWNEMSYNRNVTWEFVNTFWFKPWDWKALSSHICVKAEDVYFSGFFPWSLDDLCSNEHFIKDVVSLSKELSAFDNGKSMEDDEALLSSEQGDRLIRLQLLWNFVMCHLSSNHWSYISSHRCVTMPMMNKAQKIPWDFYSFLYNPNINWEQVQTVLRSHCADPEWISRHPTCWNLVSLTSLSIVLSVNVNIPIDKILDHLENQESAEVENEVTLFNTWELSRREDITLERLQRILALNLPSQVSVCWPAISRNKNFTWPIILSNMSYQWCWFNISMNPNITPQIVKAHSDFPWNWDGLSCNPNMSLTALRDDLIPSRQNASVLPEDKGIFSNGIGSRLNSQLVSKHINFSKLENSDFPKILNSYLQSEGRKIPYLLASREAGGTMDVRSQLSLFMKHLNTFENMAPGFLG